jgi:thiopeptide-type bacteriocin biosynthesis protein
MGMKPSDAVEPADAKTKSRSTARASLYEPIDFVMVRAPLLPVQAYLDLSDEERQLALLSNPNVRRALAVGSTSLIGAMERFQRTGLTQRDADRMRAKLLRYQIRMSTRPTPFGLFAGVALCSWGSTTDIRIQSTSALMRTRPDMAWLMDLVFSAEADPAIRKRLKLSANPLAVVEAGRVTLSESAPIKGATNSAPVSIRASGVVKRALALARIPIPHDDLVARLCETTPSATTEKVEKLLAELWERTFLLTDLRPPLTCESPARYVAKRLAFIPEASEISSRLDGLLTAAAHWDSLGAEEGAIAFADVLAKAGEQKDDSQQTPVQVDMAMSLEGCVGQSVATEAVRAAELLLRLTPSPLGLSSLASYRQAFLNRYGYEREVPLLELLDSQLGLGPTSSHGHAYVGPDQVRAAKRSQTLLHLATTALHNRQQVVILDEKQLSCLETWSPDRDTAPLSLDINILVCGRSGEAIDKGEFKVVVGPNLGAQAAGRNLGRFADLLKPEGPAALKQSADAEQAHVPDCLWAELAYLPSNLRSANVVIRPSVRPYEISLGLSAGVPYSCVIPLDELAVGVEGNRFYVRWLTAEKRVVFSSGHMLNHFAAPAVVRFLADLSHDGKALFSTFDWGQAESFPFLPRVQTGRVVLRPAQWRLQKDNLATGSKEAYDRSLKSWRAEWNVPRHVCLSFGDNRLVLDLDHDGQASELRAELLKLPDGGAMILQEVLPALDEAWLPGPGGHYYSEFVVSLILFSNVAVSKSSDAPPRHIPVQPEVSPSPIVAKTEAIAEVPRLQPPGSKWLFVKLYCPRNREEDVISESMFTFAENALASGFADSWFFIRYSDPEPHLRLRFHGSADRMMRQLFPHVCEWASRMMSDGFCLKFLFDTYEQEVERFGGLRGMTASEAVFSADSRSAVGLLRYLRTKLWPHDQTIFLALSIDDLLYGLGLSETDRLGWYRRQATPGGQDLGSEYRQRKSALRSLLGQPEKFLSTQPGGVQIASVLEGRRKALSPIAQGLRRLADQGVLSQSLDTLFASFVHLHVNRLAGLDSQSEQRVLSLLLRTREGLEKAPAAPTVPE